MASNHWIQGAIKHPGSLHRALGVPQGKKIPASKLAAGAAHGGTNEKRKIAFAKVLAKVRNG